ncbi:hypothetical protein VTN00DRAFT_846 [Thermoascus crustaceus]|uniref:uncharacterized protein n=1 Tax=Thermoascus crustaceus TaxID=5088 RepID=UPI0037432F0F
MSRNSPASGPSSSDAPLQRSRGLIEGAESSAERHTSGTADAHEPATTQSFSWHRSAPVEPPPVPTQPRSIGVHAILNPPESTAVSSSSRRSSRDGLDLPVSISPSPRKRTSSSPVSHLIHPNNQHLQADRPPLSPGTRPRRIITPVSPAARVASAGGRFNTLPGKISVSKSPFVLEPSSGVYNVPPGPQLPHEGNVPGMALSGRHSHPQPSVHSTPTFHARRASAGPATNPSSQENSPRTPHSTYSQFGHSPPAVGAGMLQPSAAPLVKTPSFPSMDPLSRLPSGPGGPRYGEETPLSSSPQDVPQGLIPVVVDYKSGSRSQAEKRKANSDASRRFRNRKKHELALEQKINSQAEEIRMLTEERDYYRAERDFYRESLGRTVGLGQLPARPPSPRQFRSSLNQQATEPGRESWRSGEGAAGETGGGLGRDTTEQLVPQGVASASQMAPIPPVAHGGWSTGPPPFAVPASNVGQQSSPDDRQIRQQQFTSPWTGGTGGNFAGGQLSHAPLTSTSAPQDTQSSARTF